jgi:hypothetical protein
VGKYVSLGKCHSSYINIGEASHFGLNKAGTLALLKVGGHVKEGKSCKGMPELVENDGGLVIVESELVETLPKL